MSGERRLPVVGVMGSGCDGHEEFARPLGRALASLPVHLLTGGGGGVMETVSGAFAAASGRAGAVIGVLPGRIGAAGWKPRPGYPNRYVELPIRTHLPLSGADGEAPASRNAINVLTADVIVILPGGEGTASEARLAVRLERPAITLGVRREGLPHADTTGQAVAFVERVVAELRAGGR